MGTVNTVNSVSTVNCQHSQHSLKSQHSSIRKVTTGDVQFNIKMVETAEQQEQAPCLDGGPPLGGTRFETAGEKNQLKCDVLCVPYPWSQAQEMDFWICKTCPENCRCNCCNFSCECIVCSKQFQCCTECFNKYGREGVAEAGNISAKLYLLYAMMAEERLVGDVKGKFTL